MSKTLIGLAPLAIGVGLYGLAVSFLLSRDMALGAWLLAAFLVGHGLVHVMFAAPRPTTTSATANGVEYPFDVSRSWLVNAGLDPGMARALAVALVVAIVIAFLLAGLATVGLLVPTGLWPGLVVAGSVASTALLLVGFSPGLAIGFAIDAVLVWVVLASAWSPGASGAAG